MAEVGSGSNNARSEWLSDNMKQSIFLKSIQHELSIYAWNDIASKNKNASQYFSYEKPIQIMKFFYLSRWIFTSEHA